MRSDSTPEDRLSRRKMLALTLSGTAAGVAGCLGGGGGGGDTTTEAATTVGDTPTTSDAIGTSGDTTTGGNGTQAGNGTQETETTPMMSPDQMADPVVDMNISWIPRDANWNHLSTGPASWFWPFDYTHNQYWNGTTDWWLLEEDGFSYDAESRTATYSFRPEYGYWWNGDPVTAEDYMIQREIQRLQDPEASPWESWEMEDEYTLVGTRKNDINPILVGLGSDRVFEYRGAWRQWLEQLRDASSASAREEIVQDLLNWEITTDEFASQGLGNGTYRLTDWSTTDMIWEKFEDHPFADQAPFPRVRFRVGSGSSANQQITQDQLDVGIGRFPSELRQTAPEYLETIYEKRSIQVRNLLFNYNRKHIGRRNVRRALVSILDWNRLVDFWNAEGGFVKQRQSGLPQALEEEWLGEEFVNDLYQYPLGSDAEAANMFMERAGYSKEGGTWIGPDGDPLEFTLMIGTYGTQEALSQAMSQSWSQWGANVELTPVTNAQWLGNVRQPSLEWDVTIFLHGYDMLNPMNYFDANDPYNMRLGRSYSAIEGWLEEGRTHSPFNGKPLTLTIPSSPGLEVGDDGGQQITIYELVQELRTTQDEERSREIIRTLSRYFNYDLPMFDAFPQIAATWGDTRDFDWPDDADLWYQKGSRAAYATLRTGLVQPVSSDQ